MGEAGLTVGHVFHYQNQQGVSLSLSSFQFPFSVCGIQPHPHLFLLKAYIFNNGSLTYCLNFKKD